MWIGLSLRILSLLFIIFQAALLDWYLVTYGGSTIWLAWIAVDFCVVAAYVASYIYADFYFQQNFYKKLRVEQPENATIHPHHKHRRRQAGHQAIINGKEKIELDVEKGLEKKSHKDLRRQDSLVDFSDLTNWENMAENVRVANLKIGKLRQKYKLGALPLAYLSWTLYAIVLAAKMLVIFLTFGERLNVHALFGSNMLELAFALTAAIFAFVVSSHKKIPKKTHQKPVIKWMQNHVMLDMLDSVELLECLYENSGEGPHKIQNAIRNSILILVSIQILLPSVGLYQLSATNFAHQDPPAYWSMIQQMLSMIFGNIPFLIIRIYLFSRRQFTESTFIFITKNVYGIITNMYEFANWFRLVLALRNNGKIPVPIDDEEDEENEEDND